MHSFRRLALIHLIVNGMLLWLAYYWLGIAESRASTLAWSACIALLIVGLGCWVYGAELVYFQTKEKAWRTALRHLIPFATAVVAAGAIYWLLAWLADSSAKPAFQIASYLTLKLRRPVRPGSVAQVFNELVWIVRWAVLPVILFPMLSSVAAQGWSGFRLIGARVRSWIYWIEAPLLLLCTLWIPLKLLGWAPHGSSFAIEMVSFVLRAAVAYLLFGAAWLALAFVTSGKPRFTQSSTVASL